MARHDSRGIATTLALGVLLLGGCAPPPVAPASTAVLYQGARLITGDGGAPIERGAILVENGTIVAVGPLDRVQVPVGAARVDLTGKTVMPALIDMHSHLGYTNVKAMTTEAGNFTRANVEDHLRRYAYYGIAATLSMGVDRGEIAFDLRAHPVPGAAHLLTAGRGIALPNAGPGAEYRKDAAYGVTTEADARQAVREMAARKADVIKIWVDDRDGTVTKLPPPMYAAIIDESHRHGLRVLAHIFDLVDAKGLLRAGVDGFAHGVRDTDIDDEFLAQMKVRPEVFVIPNLPEREVGDDFTWLEGTLPAQELQRLRASASARTPVAATAARELFEVQARNLAKLNALGVTIGFGTDSGVSVGWTAHTELADMVAAGMTPMQALVAATRTSARLLRLDRQGMLASGTRADFIVLDANPLDDITNTRRIAGVYLQGIPVDRAAIMR